MDYSRNTVWKVIAENIDQDTGTALFIVALHSSVMIVFLLRKAMESSSPSSYHKIPNTRYI